MKIRFTRIFAALTALVLLLALVSGCSGAGKSASDAVVVYNKDGAEVYYESAAAAPAAQAAPVAPDAPAAMAEPEAPMPMASTAPAGGSFEDAALASAEEKQAPDYGGHKVIRTLAVRFETDKFDDDYQALLDRAGAMGGYVQSSSIEGRKPETYRDSGRFAYLAFRIPSDKVDAFASNAKTLGTLLYYNENAEDITDRYFDSETRLDVLKIQLERLTSILTSSSELADIIELEREIADVNLQIEELTSELRRYDGLIGYSTVNVEIQELSLTAGPTREKTTGERINEGFTETLYDVGTFFVDFAVWFVSALPIILILGVIALVILLIVRSSMKKSKLRMEQMSASHGEKTQTPAPFPGDENNQGENKND